MSIFPDLVNNVAGSTIIAGRTVNSYYHADKSSDCISHIRFDCKEKARSPRGPTSFCIFAADLLALSLVYWLSVIGRYLINPNYDLHFYLSLYPVIAIFLAAFYVHNLYPGILLHPAEEMRRVFKCVSIVFLLVALGTFIERSGTFYSRSIFLVVWVCGVPSVLPCAGIRAKQLGAQIMVGNSNSHSGAWGRVPRA